MSNSQLNKLKSGLKYGTEVTLKVSSNIVGDYNDENNSPHKLLLSNTQVSKLRQVFAIIILNCIITLNCIKQGNQE